MTDKSKKLGVVLVGFGSYSEERLAPALQETKHCYLAGIVSSTTNKKNEWKKKYHIDGKNIYSYKDFDSIKDNDAVDIVYVVLPNSMHKEYVLRAAKAGKHVICEKPMATSVQECDEMIEACEKAGVRLSVGYRLHFDPYNLEMMRLAKEKKYGNVKMVFASHGLYDANGWRLNKDLAGGGPLMDVGIYCVNAARYITNKEPLTVQAFPEAKHDKKKFNSIEEAISWNMEYDDGVIAKCHCSYSEASDYLRVEAEHGWFELEPAFFYNSLKGKTSEGKMKIKPINQQAAQLDDFALAIMENRPTPVPGEMGRQDIKILEAIYQSANTGKRVEIN